MAKICYIGIILLISCLYMFTSNVYKRNQTPTATATAGDVCGGKEEIIKLRFYVHDLRVGNPTPTVYEVAKASITADSAVNFGSVHVADDLITAGPEMNSTAVGRIQGLTTSADMATSTAALNLNVYFTAGRFNGSTISIVGRNEVMNSRRELAVGGGTGAFRFARGYAVQSTAYYDAATSYGVFEYTIYTTYNYRFSINGDIEIAQM